MNNSAEPRSIVVGIDGSKAAIGAALWAVDEAVSRDITLRLLSAVEPGDAPAAAETAVRHAVAAIQDAGTPAKIETRVTAGPAARSLVRASASAALVCVGAVGLRHFQPGRVGSTAAAVATSAHCPVAIVRGRPGPEGRRPADQAAAIAVELDGAPDNGVLLGTAIEEARLRGAAVHAVVRRRADEGDAGEGDHRALADLDRRLARWKRRYPDLQVESVVAPGLLEYVAAHRSVRLAVVGARNRQHLGELVGPLGAAKLQEADCSLLIVNRQHL